jgi:hypothetical protein
VNDSGTFIGNSSAPLTVAVTVEGPEKYVTEEKEARRKPTWKRGPRKGSLLSKLWRLTGLSDKKLWDWLQLLIVPLVLAGIGIVFSMQQEARQLALEEQRAQDAALQGYLDQMSRLVLEDLSNDKVRTLWRARTLTVLERLDPSRKTQVMRFLAEAGLVQAEAGLVQRETEVSEPIIDLGGTGGGYTDTVLGAPVGTRHEAKGADLSGADLNGFDLRYVDLSAADLSDANLEGAKLDGADLRDANLQDANLHGASLYKTWLYDPRFPKDAADLSGTNLSNAYLRDAPVTEEMLEQAGSFKGAIMPNGQKYEEWLKSKSRGENR